MPAPIDSAFWQPAFWRYASVPLAALLAGWLTHRLAAALARRQAPARARRTAEALADSLRKLVGPEELFARFGPDLVAAQILKVAVPRLRRITDETVLEQDAPLWRATPELVRQRICANLEESLPRRIAALVREAHERAGELVDYRQLVASRLAADPALAERLAAALRPLGAFPPRRLSAERRAAAAAAFCHLAASELLSVRAVVHAMLEGKQREETAALIRRHLEPIVDDGVGALKTGIEVALGRGKIIALREAVGRQAEAHAAHPFADWQFNRERSEQVETMLRERLEPLPAEDFAALLRPCREPSRRPLLAGLLAGALAGLLAGAVQALLLLGS